MRFCVVGCSACQEVFATESRHLQVSCPRCAARFPLDERARLWQGDSNQEAQVQAGVLRARQHGVSTVALEREAPLPRHDSPLDAAAARSAGIVNKSARSEAVALWMSRLVGPTPHGALIDALGRAGIDQDRAEAEVTRMLARDIIFEPRAGSYLVLGA